ncbi:methyl-accepting chemotaxis protein [Sphingomonas sp. IC-56]|uniref:methyl-accepting chemotaxis protein n=1 Tax=Sphingomonas sp. IC-56 TaxID=2898529 RepID=UPI001E638B30|nr:methyl-accepting chemotaxis protein [Sphingomonas sp. IC-56]MCD2325108.1 methyl-accepting chemotaxis protein [Sphingomonas sp. IC-56]
MKTIENLKISTKILAMMLVLGLLSVAIAFTGSNAMRTVDADYSVLTDTALPNNLKLARVNRRLTEMAYAAYRTMAYDGNSAEARAASESEQAAYQQALDQLKEVRESEPALAARVDTLKASLDDVHGKARQAIAFGMRNDDANAKATMTEVDKRVADLGKDMKAFNDHRVAEAEQGSAALTAQISSASSSMLLMSVIGTIAVLGVGLWLIRRTISMPVKQLSDTMRALAAGNNRVDVAGTDRRDEIGDMAKAVLVFREGAVAKEKADIEKTAADAEQKLVVDTLAAALGQMSQGDLTGDIRTEFTGGYAELKTNFNGALSSLRTLIGSVTESAAAIRTGSGEIAQASEDLARRTEANAASLEETSAAVTQMDGRLKATADAANRTVVRADGAISTVEGGRTIADEAVQAMARVADGAKGIDSVIEGLDKIAFQTRVLAMNAAVEAGRAGEAGRGFAVVADLVSALAMRSEEEAARARDQLTATQTDIVSAVEMVQKVDGALANISGDVAEVHSLLGQMAADNQAQSTAITQISVAIGTMDQSTQQNAAMVEETSAAARNLSSEVSALAEQAAKFDVGVATPKSFRPAAAPSARPAAPVAPAAYRSPVKPLPASISPASDDDWTSF